MIYKSVFPIQMYTIFSEFYILCMSNLENFNLNIKVTQDK